MAEAKPTKNIVILGAGWTGLPLAHKLLKYTLPKTPIKVFLVAPNTKFFYNVAATRGLIPGAIPDQDLFLPLEPGFSRYPAGSFEFVQGTATSIAPETNTVVVALNEGGGGATRALPYDQLVIATGSRVRGGAPMKPLGTDAETDVAWKAMQANVDKASTIVVAGAGPTGVEVAGELAAHYGPKKTVTLISSGQNLLSADPEVLASVRSVVEKDLQKLGVKMVKGARVESVTRAEGEDSNSSSNATGKATLKLSNGDTLEADCYLAMHGIQLNTSFVPAQFLDADSNIKLTPTMRVDGADNIWGIGDVGNLEVKQLTITDNQIIYLADALDKILAGQDAAVQPYKKESKTLIFISLGKKFATGQVGTWRLWGIMVSPIKGKKLFVDKAPGYVSGQQLRHSSL